MNRLFFIFVLVLIVLFSLFLKQDEPFANAAKKLIDNSQDRIRKKEKEIEDQMNKGSEDKTQLQEDKIASYGFNYRDKRSDETIKYAFKNGLYYLKYDDTRPAQSRYLNMFHIQDETFFDVNSNTFSDGCYELLGYLNATNLKNLDQILNTLSKIVDITEKEHSLENIYKRSMDLFTVVYYTNNLKKNIRSIQDLYEIPIKSEGIFDNDMANNRVSIPMKKYCTNLLFQSLFQNIVVDQEGHVIPYCIALLAGLTPYGIMILRRAIQRLLVIVKKQLHRMTMSKDVVRDMKTDISFFNKHRIYNA